MKWLVSLLAAAAVAVAVAAVAVALPAGEQRGAPDALHHVYSVYNQSMELEEMLEMGMEAAALSAPSRGCAPVEGAGETRLLCALPAARAPLALATDRATYLTVTCESDASGRPGEFRCEELREEASALLHGQTQGEGEGEGEGPVLRNLAVVGCELAGPLRCALRLVGARDAASLTLRGVPTPLTPAHFAGLHAVTVLHVIDFGEEVSDVPYEALGALPALERLALRGGALRLRARWRPPLPALRALELADARLQHLPAAPFDGLPLLANLSLWGNGLENLTSDSFQGVPLLERLSLNQNALKTIPSEALLATPQLKFLNLHSNELRTLPRAALRQLQHLEEIRVNNRNRSTLALEEDTFAELAALQTLSLESCGLRALAAGALRGVRALRSLSLAGNALETLPGALLHAAPALRRLDLARNRLAALPRDLLARSPALDTLDLSRNALRELPEGVFRGLSSLKSLDVSHNEIEKLHSRTFEGLSSLEELSLSYNRLRFETAEESADGERRSALWALRSLRRLALRHNAVRALPDDWRDLVYLRSLDLSYNRITELSDVDLEFMGEAEVDVRHNAIRTVQFDPRRDFGEHTSRAVLLLAHNPFACDCYVYDLVVALARPEVAKRLRVEGAQCAGPPELAGSPLQAAPPAALTCALAAPACPARCSCTVRPAAALLDLDCDAAPRAVPSPRNYGVYAVRLRLRAAPPDLTALPPEVRILDLSGLGLATPPAILARVDDLTVDLSGNELTVAPLGLLEANAKIRLVGNRIACDCEHRESIAGLERHWGRVLDGPALRCRDGGRVEGSPAARLCAMRDAVVLGGSLAALGLALAAFAVLAFRYSTEIRLVLRRYEWLDFLFDDEHSLGPEKRYDAFVSFSHRDDEFVRGELVPRLEGGRRPLRLCLHYRDWEVGGVIPQQIDRSVRESRRTIVVLSRDFLESGWGRVEFRAAHGLERVIVVLRGDVLRAAGMDAELRAYLTTNTYVHEDDPLVWDRVREAVRRSRSRVAPHAAPAADKLTLGALDVQLRDGRLVNVKY